MEGFYYYFLAECYVWCLDKWRITFYSIVSTFLKKLDCHKTYCSWRIVNLVVLNVLVCSLQYSCISIITKINRYVLFISTNKQLYINYSSITNTTILKILNQKSKNNHNNSITILYFWQHHCIYLFIRL